MSQIKPAASDLAAELLLNKLMNKQVEAASGRTVTPGSRAMSSALSSDAYAVGLAAPTMEYGKSLVSVAQTGATQLASDVKKIQEMVATATEDNALDVVKKITKIWAQSTAFATGATVSGQKLYAGTGVDLDAGMGQKINILGQKIDLAADDFAGLDAAIKALTTPPAATAAETAAESATPPTGADALAKLKALNATDKPMVDNAIQSLNNYVANYGYDIRQLDERATVLNTWSADLNEGAANQYINDMSGTSDLVDNILGTTTEA